MGNEITWRNINTPDVARGQALLRALASKQLNSAFNPVKATLKEQADTEEANWQQQKQNTTQALLSHIASTDDYNAINSIDPEQLQKQYGAQYNAAAVTKALTERKNAIANDLAGAALLHTSAKDLKPAERRSNIADFFKQQGVEDGLAAKLTEQTMQLGKGKFNDIHQAVKEQNTQEFLKGITTLDPNLALNLAYEKFGTDGVDTNMVKTAVQGKLQTRLQQFSDKISKMHKNHATIPELLDVIRSDNSLPIASKAGLYNQMIKLYSPSATETQLADIHAAEESLKLGQQYEEQMRPVVTKLATLKPLVESHTLGNLMATAQNNPNYAGLDSLAVANDIFVKNDTNRKFWADDVDMDDIQDAEGLMRQAGIPIEARIALYKAIEQGKLVTQKGLWDLSSRPGYFRELVQQGMQEYKDSKSLHDTYTQLANAAAQDKAAADNAIKLASLKYKEQFYKTGKPVKTKAASVTLPQLEAPVLLNKFDTILKQLNAKRDQKNSKSNKSNYIQDSHKFVTRDNIDFDYGELPPDKLDYSELPPNEKLDQLNPRRSFFPYINK